MGTGSLGEQSFHGSVIGLVYLQGLRKAALWNARIIHFGHQRTLINNIRGTNLDYHEWLPRGSESVTGQSKCWRTLGFHTYTGLKLYPDETPCVMKFGQGTSSFGASQSSPTSPFKSSSMSQ